MNTTNQNNDNQTVAESCDYCGRQNPNRLPECSGCGTRLGNGPADPEMDSGPKRKSKALAVCLALIFGPLGLLYVRSSTMAFTMIVITAPFMLTRTKGGLWLMLGIRVLAAVWAFFTVVEHDETPNERRDAVKLLHAAATLENVDRAKAIAAYEAIVKAYPNTAASKEAQANISILAKQA